MATLRPGYSTERGRLEMQVEALRGEIATQVGRGSPPDGEFVTTMRQQLRSLEDRLSGKYDQ